MAWKGGFDRDFDVEEFRAHVDTLSWTKWRPSSITIHHTGAPTLEQWMKTPVPGVPNPTMLQRGRTRMKNLEHYYKNQMKWSSGPHLFVADRIFLGTPLTVSGTHAVSFNGSSLGLEIAGNYDVEELGGVVLDNTVKALAILCEALGLEPTASTLKFHRDDPKTSKSCPGRKIQKKWIVDLVSDQMGEDLPGEHVDDQDETEAPAVYVVQKGDTLSGISRRTGLDVKELIKRNGGHDRIAVGQVLSLGGATPPVTAAAPPAPPAPAPASTPAPARAPTPATPAGARSVSSKGAAVGAREEGVVLVTYMDGEVPAIGMGHNDKTLPMDKKITLQEALDLYKKDNVWFDSVLAKYIKVPAQQHEWDAMHLLAHNIGSGNFGGSAVLRFFNAGDKAAAAEAFKRWHRGNGIDNLLLARREREVKLFLTGDYGDLTQIPVYYGDPRKTKPVKMVLPF